MRDVDGNAWLVPGYAMQQPEGWWSATVSLIEGVIELPAPFEGDITPYRED
jgi:sugar (pentulose or hexulose) kinase